MQIALSAPNSQTLYGARLIALILVAVSTPIPMPIQPLECSRMHRIAATTPGC
jgi:hypothetical protein